MDGFPTNGPCCLILIGFANPRNSLSNIFLHVVTFSYLCSRENIKFVQESNTFSSHCFRVNNSTKVHFVQLTVPLIGFDQLSFFFHL